jgi:hypothetical protein
MDKDTKQLLLSVCQTLRQVTDSAYHAHELALRLYGALVEAGVNGFAEAYTHPKMLSFQQIIELRDSQLKLLDDQIQRLQQ